MSDPTTIATGYLALWNEADDTSRRARLSDSWADDARYTDPMMSGFGRDGIAQMIAGARAQFPGRSPRNRCRAAGRSGAHRRSDRFSRRQSGMSPAFIARGHGHGLFVRDWGSGPPVLLMAGWAMDSRIWGETMLGLNAAGLRTIAYDRRGHGRSTEWGGCDYAALADDLAAVLDALDLREVTLVTHSGAGGEAIRYLARHGRERVRRLVLVGATGPRVMARPGEPGFTPAMLDALCGRLATDLSGWIDENIEPFAPGTPARVNDWLAAMVLDCSRHALVAFQRAIAETDLTADAATLALPVTIIHGDRDVSAPIETSAHRYAEIIPGAELIVYPGVAHGVMVTDNARLTADISARVMS